MTNWLERARREIPRSASRDTAKSDEGSPSAVTAVAAPGESENSRPSIGSNGGASVLIFPEVQVASAVTAELESAIRSWLAQIDETDEAIIAHVLNQWRQDADAHAYFNQCAEVPEPDRFPDDRRRCDQCLNLTERGLCLAARRGEIGASLNYEPVRDLLRRCERYLPAAD